jgi:hypothetical protein
VNTQKLGAFLKEKVQICAAVHGGAFQAATSHLPSSIAEQLNAAMESAEQ